MFMATAANAQEEIKDMSAVRNPEAKEMPTVQASHGIPVFTPQARIADGSALKPLKKSSTQGNVAKRSAAKTVHKAPPASTASLSGEYVLSYNTLTTSSFDGGSSVTIVPDSEGDSITIKRFWAKHDVRAHVNTTTGEVTIPRQHLYTDDTFGDMYLGVVRTDGTVDKNAQLTGTVDADGNFALRREHRKTSL